MLRIRRSFAALATSAVAFSGLAALAPAATAAASDVTVACSIPVFDISWDSQVSADVNFPAKVQVGKEATYAFTGQIVIPDRIRDTARFLGGTSMSGAGKVSGSFGGVKSAVDITIASTPVPATSGDLKLEVKGSATVVPTKVGAAALVADGLTATLTLGKADGTSASLAVTCAPAAAFEIATVDVTAAPKAPVKAASKTTVKIAKKGKKATATITVKAGKKAATGKVTVKLTQGKKSKKVTVKLNSKGVAKASFNKLAKGRFTVKATYAGNATTKASSKTANGKI